MDIISLAENFYSSVHFPVQLVNAGGKIIYINSAFSLIWGYSLAELSEYNLFDDFELRKAGNTDVMKEVLSTGKTKSISGYSDSLLKTKELVIPLLTTKVSTLCIKKEKYLLLLHDDQTDLYLAEEEIKKAREVFRESERLMNTFLNVLSHELRTPLNIILGYSTLIKENLKDKLSGEEKIYIENLYIGSERLFKSITQMLEFAQIEAGNYKLNLERLNLINIIKNTVGNFYKPASEKNIDIKTIFNEEEIFVDVDLNCVENALSNLLNNAVKFTQQGFIEIEASISKARSLAVCRVKDTGVGISSEYMDHLFQPFSQEDLQIGRSYEGNGLGLALSKRYIEKLGGSLLVDSIKGVGTTFTFTLPLAAEVSGGQQSAVIKSSELKKVLMLDDSGESYELLNAYLRHKYSLEVFGFRKFGLELLKDEIYKAIIFDVHQSHWEQSLLICSDIKKHDPFARPVIVLSSEFIEEKINKFYEAGADKFIVKPFSKNDLIIALESV
jgi:two-component system, sensor histidine kinase